MTDETVHADDRITPVDEVKLLRAAACDWRNSRGDVAVFASVLMHANKAWRCFPGPSKLAGLARLSVTNVKASLKRLEQLGYIAVERPGLRKKNRFQVLTPPDVPTRNACISSSDVHQPESRDGGIPSSTQAEARSGDAGEPSSDGPDSRTGDACMVPTGDASMLQLGMPTRHEYASNTPSKTQQLDQQPEGPADRFDEFWALYPRKDAKARAAAVWRSKKLDQVADRLIADVRARVADPGQWSDSKFIPHASTFLNGKRWEDEWPRSQHSATVTTLPRETNHEAINAASMRRLGIAP
jgi:hypothetical protein